MVLRVSKLLYSLFCPSLFSMGIIYSSWQNLPKHPFRDLKLLYNNYSGHYEQHANYPPNINRLRLSHQNVEMLE